MKRLCKHTTIFLILTLLLLFLSSGLFPLFASAHGQEEYEYISGDWSIDTNVTRENYTVALSDNLTVKENGILLLSNLTLLLNSTHGEIIVEEGGKLFVRNTTIISPYQHEMYLYGEAELENCTLINLEVQVMSNAVIIANSTVQNSSGYGIIIKDSSPKIINNTVTANKGGGILTMGSGALICRNKVVGNSGDGIYSENSSDILTGNEIGGNGAMGVNLSNSYSQIENNTIFNNTLHGVFLRDGESMLSFNRFEGNKWGAKLVDSTFMGENNTFLQNENGEVLQSWNLTVKILNSNRKGIEDVSIAITNRDGSMFWGGVVNRSLSLTLSEYEIINNSKRMYSPYSIYVEKSSSWAEENVSLNQSKEVIIKLLSDVEIEDIIIPTNASSNKNATIEVLFNNPFGIRIQVPVIVVIDNITVYNDTILLGGNSGMNISLPWYATSGTHKIEVFIDKNDSVEEVNESNNYAYRWITVGEIGDGGKTQMVWVYLVIIGIIVMVLAASLIIILGRKT